MDYSVPTPIPPVASQSFFDAERDEQGAILAKRYRNGETLTREEMQQLHSYMWQFVHLIHDRDY